MFYYRTSFSKKAIFLEETAKNLFVGGHDRFEGRGASGDKNQYNLFCRYRRFEYFLSNNFLPKKQYFPKYKRKIIFGGRHHFRGNGGADDKNEYNLFFDK